MNASNMTVSECLAHCYMYKYAGLKAGSQCWCGDTLDLAGDQGATPGKNVTAQKCDYACRGNHSSHCGGQKSLNLYSLKEEEA
jgi:hypothetical protein